MTMQKEGKQLQVILTTGLEDPERAAFGFGTALVAASAGVSVIVFLSIQSPVWACADLNSAEGVERVSHVLEQAVEAGVQIEACSTCFDKFCSGRARPELRDGIRIAGMLSVVQRSTEGVPTITF